MQGNTRTQISFPDKFRPGLVVEHHGNPFCITFALSGSVVGLAGAAVSISDAFTFGGGRKSAKLEYIFNPEDSAKMFTIDDFSGYLNEMNGRFQKTETISQ